MGNRGGGGRTDAGPNRTTAYKKGVGMINEKGKEVSKNAFRNRGKDSVDRFKTPATMILGPALKANSVYNRDFFTDKVLTSTKGMKNFGYSSKEFSNLSADKQESIYKTYSRGRLSGETDAYGGKISQSTLARREQKRYEQPKVPSQMDNTGVKSDLITADKTAPTNVEMTDDEYSVATKKKGRKRTVLTSVTGDTTKPQLSKKVLLG